MCDRLHHEADDRVAVREKAKRAMEEREMQQYSFRPRINEAATDALVDMSNHRPLHERVGELQRQRNENLQKLRMRKEMDPELTFQPSGNAIFRLNFLFNRRLCVFGDVFDWAQ